METDDLYGLPLEQFIPERGKLARELRAAGRGDQAAEVAKLRKPSAAAWVVNQLIRTQRKEVAALFEAGDAVRAAQDDVLGGAGDARDLRVAVANQRAAVEKLVGAGRGLLSGEGHAPSGTVLERVADTLHSAGLTEDGREQVRDGRLERELVYVGLGGAPVAGLGAAPPAAKPGKSASTSAPSDPRPTPKQQARDQAAARRALREAEGDARRAAEVAARALEVANERHDRAADALAEAERALEQARASAESTAEAHRRALEQLEAN
jgi:hypothetical protein